MYGVCTVYRTDVEEAPSGEGQDPAGPRLQRLDRIQGERRHRPQHPHARRPGLRLARLPPARGVTERYVALCLQMIL